MRHVSSCVRLLALSFLSLPIISCQKQLDLEAGLPQASGIYVTESSGFPGVVMVSIPGGGICSGTIVSHKAVLTAAHCTKRVGNYIVVGNFADPSANGGRSQKSTSVVSNFGPGAVEDPNDISILVFLDQTFQEQDIIPIGDASRAGEVATLVGYGCSNLDTRTGAGKKRMGTNVIAQIHDYIEFYTPLSSATSSARARGIIGSTNRAGSCFGDSGGPALAENGGKYAVVGVTHAGGVIDNTIVSQYADVSNRADNRAFISQINKDQNLGIAGF